MPKIKLKLRDFDRSRHNLILSSIYFHRVELSTPITDMPYFEASVASVKFDSLLHHALLKNPIPLLRIRRLENFRMGFFHYEKQGNKKIGVMEIDNSELGFTIQHNKKICVAQMARSKKKYREGIFIHEYGHWLADKVPNSRQIIEDCRGKAIGKPISEYSIKGYGFQEFFCEYLVAYEWFKDKLRVKYPNELVMVETILSELANTPV